MNGGLVLVWVGLREGFFFKTKTTFKRGREGWGCFMILWSTIVYYEEKLLFIEKRQDLGLEVWNMDKDIGGLQS